MHEELVLEGNQYRGRFLARLKSGEFWHGSHGYEHKDTEYWYEGVGIIEDIKTGEKHRFLLKTEHDAHIRESKLEYEIICFCKVPFDRTQHDEIMSRIIDRLAVIDLELKIMYDDGKNREEAEIVPKVYPTPLNFEELTERGFVADEFGQIRIPFVASS